MTVFPESNYLVLGLSKTVLGKCDPQLFFMWLWTGHGSWGNGKSMRKLKDQCSCSPSAVWGKVVSLEENIKVLVQEKQIKSPQKMKLCI